MIRIKNEEPVTELCFCTDVATSWPAERRPNSLPASDYLVTEPAALLIFRRSIRARQSFDKEINCLPKNTPAYLMGSRSQSFIP